MPFMELLLCEVTGEMFLPAHFPPCWALPRRPRVCWVRPSLVRKYSKDGNDGVSLKSPATGEEQAVPAALRVPRKGDA